MTVVLVNQHRVVQRDSAHQIGHLHHELLGIEAPSRSVPQQGYPPNVMWLPATYRMIYIGFGLGIQQWQAGAKMITVRRCSLVPLNLLVAVTRRIAMALTYSCRCNLHSETSLGWICMPSFPVFGDRIGWL